MKPKIARALLGLPLSLVLMLGGCEHLPQKTTVNPDVNVGNIDIGNGREIAFKLEDERPSKIIGRRGAGSIEGAEIVPAADVGMVFQQEISNGLEMIGFQVIPYSDNHPLRMVIELRELKYSTSLGFWTVGVHMNAAMEVQAFSGDAKYEEFYRTAEEETVIFMNSADENDELINKAASNLLQQFFDDLELRSFLMH